MTTNADQLWKALIMDYYPAFIEFFFPKIYPLVDFSKPIDFLETELKKLFPIAKTKRRVADILAKIHLLDGTEHYILCHTEIQGYIDYTFPERVFTTFYRLFDRFRVPITCLAIYTDDSIFYKPDNFVLDFFIAHFFCFTLTVFHSKLIQNKFSQNPIARRLL